MYETDGKQNSFMMGRSSTFVLLAYFYLYIHMLQIVHHSILQEEWSLERNILRYEINKPSDTIDYLNCCPKARLLMRFQSPTHPHTPVNVLPSNSLFLSTATLIGKMPIRPKFKNLKLKPEFQGWTTPQETPLSPSIEISMKTQTSQHAGKVSSITSRMLNPSHKCCRECLASRTKILLLKSYSSLDLLL